MRKGVGQVAGIVLAAGTSSRFGAGNKLLVPIAGQAVVRRTALAYLGAGLQPLIVVLGHQAKDVRAVLDDLPVHCVLNPRYEEGQSTSLLAGIGALPAGVPAAVIGVGDQPYLTPSVVQRLVGLWAEDHSTLVVPRYAGTRGNPVVFPASLFSELLSVSGDVGGRPVIQRHLDTVRWADFDDPRIGLDVDVREDIERLQMW